MVHLTHLRVSQKALQRINTQTHVGQKHRRGRRPHRRAEHTRMQFSRWAALHWCQGGESQSTIRARVSLERRKRLRSPSSRLTQIFWSSFICREGRGMSLARGILVLSHYTRMKKTITYRELFSLDISNVKFYTRNINWKFLIGWGMWFTSKIWFIKLRKKCNLYAALRSLPKKLRFFNILQDSVALAIWSCF